MANEKMDDQSQCERNFADPQEEIAYLKLKLNENQSEFQEFQESSRELEAEYETQVKQLEVKLSEALAKISRLEDENEQLRAKHQTYTTDTQIKFNDYQRQISELTELNTRWTDYIRELEQSNDDLERAQRALAASLDDFEGQLNQQIERNVLLENEVSEKEELECLVQRLKEEARDLRHELIANKSTSESAAKRKQQLILDMDQISQNSLRDQSISPLVKADSAVDTVTEMFHKTNLNGMDKQKSSNVVDSTTSPMTPKTPLSRFSFSPIFSNSQTKSTDSKSQQTSSPGSPTLPPIVVTPSSRISALNIVSDLLRKVGALESKLTSAKRVASQSTPNG